MITYVNYKCDGYYINCIKLVNKLNLRNNQKKTKGENPRETTLKNPKN